MARARGSPARRSPARKPLTPFPYKQLGILGLCRICEPIAFMSIFPYIYAMVKWFGIAKTENEISMYAGMVTSAFTFAEFSCAPLWGRFSDKVGRKPVIMIGLAGTGVSMIVMGFAPNLATAILARALGGMLNGNIGVLQTTVAEVVTVKEHQPRAYTVMPFVWGVGSIIGPVLGGVLAEPVKNYPNLFAENTIWDRFPFLLTNLFCVGVCIMCVTLAWLFIEETHSIKKHDKDRGVELGKKLLGCFSRRCAPASYEKLRDHSDSEAESVAMLSSDSLRDESGEELPDYRSNESTPLAHPVAVLPIPDHFDLDEIPQPLPKKAFTRQVVLNIAAYGLLAYHTITFDQMLPLILSTANSPVHDGLALPFKFKSGFGLPTSTTGVVLMVQGAFSMCSTLFLFPYLAKRFGAINVFRTIAFAYPILYFTAPYILLLPQDLRFVALGPLMAWKVAFSTCSFPATAILLANSAPSVLMLGTINGVAASAASFNRALGPTIAGYLFAKGQEWGYSGLPFWCSGVVACGGAVLSLSLNDKNNREDMKEEVIDEEALEVERDD